MDKYLKNRTELFEKQLQEHHVHGQPYLRVEARTYVWEC